MAIISSGKTVSVFKFAGTGLVALMDEVTYYIKSKDPVFRNVDLSSARYENIDGDHYIHFDRKQS